MKKLVYLAALPVLFATPAFAQATDSSSEEFDVTATVPDVCAMADIQDISLGDVNINRASGADSLLINSTSTGNSGQFYVSCNDTTTVSIETQNGGLQNPRALLADEVADGFTNLIEYNLRLDNFYNATPNSGQPKLSTNDHGPGGVATAAPRGAMHRLVTAAATILPAQNNQRPIAGAYTDTVTVTVTTS